MQRSLYVLTIVVALIAACGSADNRDGGEHTATVKAWRADRLARLTAPDGYLRLAGLYWLDEGTNSFGSGADNDLVFPAGAERIGAFDLADGLVNMTVHDGVDVRIDGVAVTSVAMPDDTTDAEVMATLDSFAWMVIERAGKVGLRLWDRNNPAVDALPPIPYYNIDSAWRVDATLRRYETPRVTGVGTVIEGLGWNPISPGVVEFDLAGKRHTLEAYESGERLFFVFGDTTNRDETYPAGRFLYADMPAEDGSIELDFNRAYNPPCAFNDFATCPIASPRNRLKLAVSAGEKYIPALHFGAAH